VLSPNRSGFFYVHKEHNPMAAEATPVVGQEPSAGTGQEPTTTQPQAGTESTQSTMTLEEAQAALKAARHDAASYRTRLANLEKAEQGKYKELAEAAKREADELRVQVARRDHADLQRVVAGAYKLPDSLASRLQGNTREELEADAKDLAKLITSTESPTPAPGNRAGPRPQPGPGLEEKTEAYLRSTGRYQAI